MSLPSEESKKYIVDTNCLLDNPEIINQYETVIPSSVLREIEDLEKKRKSDRTLQFQIRRAKRFLDEDNNHIYVDLKDYKFTLDGGLDGQYVDNILLQVAIDNNYGMITNDKLLKEKCKLYGIPLVNARDNKTFVEYKGFKEVTMTEDDLRNVYKNLGINQFDLIINEYIIINDNDGELLDVMKWDGESLVSLRDKKGKLGKGFKTDLFKGFVPKDEYQIMATDSIFTNQITSLRGPAGSGKSMIALNTAWAMVEKDGYKLVVFCNPVPSLNAQELGFYSGNKTEKLLQSSVGNMLKSKFGGEDEVMRHIAYGKLDILPFVDLRGYDTSDNTIVWISEAQNLTSELLKLGLERIGDGSKVIIDGDYHLQVDKDIYAVDNGMKRMSEVFRGIDVYGEVELQNVWRSRIAEIAQLM